MILIKIHTYEIPGPMWVYSVIQGVRNSWESWEKSDSELGTYDERPYLEIGPLDLELCLKLIRAGKDHGKFLRQIPVLIEFTAPEYFLKEFDTYKISTVSDRTSMMHTLGKEEFNADMFSWEDFPDQDEYLELLNKLRGIWIASGKRKGPQSKEWNMLIKAVPQSWNYLTCWTGNYQTLRDMYFARKNHRLSEWRDFCDFIETLPYSDLITHKM